MENTTQPKQRHQWQRSPILENWENCRNCQQKRRKAQNKYYYDSSEISKTYCEPSEIKTQVPESVLWNFHEFNNRG